MSYKKVYPSKAIGQPVYTDLKVTYTNRDTLLYNISIGIAQQGLDESNMKYIYELDEEFCSICSFTSTLGLQDLLINLSSVPGIPAIDLTQILHSETSTEFIQHLPTEATLTIDSIVSDVVDKKKFGIISFQLTIYNQDKTIKYCVMTNSIIVKKLGEFMELEVKGAKADKLLFGNSFELRSHENVFEYKTSKNQAIIYRLNGDWNPLHIDPSFATLGGFDQPILHGLATYGISYTGFLKYYKQSDVVSMGARFLGPVIPGDTLKIYFKKEGMYVHYQTFNARTSKICVVGSIKVKNIKAKL